MSDVFISYAREDRAQAADLAELLEGSGYSVWWDANLAGGTQFRSVIDENLAKARKVIVLWSENSVRSSFVVDEAQEAKEKRKLIPISIDSTRPPLGFRDIHTLRVSKFNTVRDEIIASIEGKQPRESPLARLNASRKQIYIVIATILPIVLATVMLILYLISNARPTTELVYKVYSSSDIGVTFAFPQNILSVDTTERKHGRISLRDGSSQSRVKIFRTTKSPGKDIKLGQQEERTELEKLGYTITYMAPEKEKNWSNWYVLSGLTNNTVFYYRRWYFEDGVGSIEFIFPKEINPLYDKIIPEMTQSIVFSSIPQAYSR